MVRAFVAAAIVSVAALTASCGKKRPPAPPMVEVEGVVRLDGKPLNKAMIRFLPLIDCGPEYLATGVTDETGHYRLKCKTGQGALACEHEVTVTESEAPANVRNSASELSKYLQSLGGRPLPQKYTRSGELSADVKVGQTEYNFDLQR